VVLEDKVAVLANFNASNVSLIDLNSGEGRLLLVTAPARPEGLFVEKLEENSSYRVFVLLQGLDENYSPNKEQGILVFTLKRIVKKGLDQWRILDKKIKKIPLKSNTGFGFFHKESGKPLVVGLCNRYNEATCTSSIERLDPEKLEVEEVFKFKKHTDYLYLGSIAEGESENVLYANVESKEKDSVYHPKVVKINLESGKTKVMHSFGEIKQTDPPQGQWGMFFEKKEKLLFVGDSVDRLTGKFTVYKDGKKIETISLKAIPYTGTFFVQ
jgi:hypothetical protein